MPAEWELCEKMQMLVLNVRKKYHIKMTGRSKT